MMTKTKTDVVELFNHARMENTYIRISAPMVRYSKLQFRTLVKRHGVDLCFTPMILADSFCQSLKARNNEFTTGTQDSPLIVQFAAKRSQDFVSASELVYPYADGVDLNCGCPQRWAMKDGYGCALLAQPEVIHGLVREFKNRLSSKFSISVKVRLLKDFKDSVNFCRQLESCGVTFLTVHGRTASQKTSEPVNLESLAELRKCISIPFIANGDVRSLDDANRTFDLVKCDGIMSARGLLSNPAAFLGSSKTPLQCVQDWMNICLKDRDRIIFQTYHHHLVFMLEKHLSKIQKRIFNYLNNYHSVDQFLLENFNLVPFDISSDEHCELLCDYDVDVVNFYGSKRCQYCLKNYCDCMLDRTYDSNESKGQYFSSLVNKKEIQCDLDYMDGSLFDEE